MKKDIHKKFMEVSYGDLAARLLAQLIRDGDTPFPVCSSTVESPSHKRVVAGSTPAGRTSRMAKLYGGTAKAL